MFNPTIKEWKRTKIIGNYNKIIKILNEKSLKANDLWEAYFEKKSDEISKNDIRTLQYRLGELQNLQIPGSEGGLIGVDDKGYYYLNKKKHYTEKELERELKHSIELIKSIEYADEDTDEYDPFVKVDELIFPDIHNIKDVFNKKQLMNHIETGYRDLNDLIIPYRSLISKYPELILGRIEYGSDEKRINDNGDAKDENNQISESEYELIQDSREQIIGKLEGLIHKVRNGTPLKGTCEDCPSENYTIVSKAASQ